MKINLIGIFLTAGLIILLVTISVISCAPPIHTGGSGGGDEYDLSTSEGLQRALEDEEYMQSLEPVFAEAGSSAEFMYGDVNGDGVVDITDAFLTARHYVGYTDAGFIYPESADVNDDGGIDIVDALLIARYYVELIDSFEAEKNLFLNGHFHAGDKYWEYFEQEGGSGSMQVVDGELKVTVDDGGSYIWSVGIAQFNFNLEAGKSYTFTFKARTSSVNTTELRSVFQLQQEPWTGYGGQNFILAQEMATYSFTFTMSETDSEAGFNFHMGAPNIGDIYIDDVGLYEIDNNLIKNGQFDNGYQDWDFQINGFVQGSLEVINGELKVAITDGGQRIWDISSSQTGIPLKQGSSYIFTFKARKTSTEPLLVEAIIQNSPPWEIDYDKAFFYLTEEMQTHAYLFHMNESTDTNSQFVLCFGYVNSGDVYVDDICLYEVTDPSMLDGFSNSSSVAKLKPYSNVRWQDASQGTLSYEWVKTLYYNEDTIFNVETQAYANTIMDKARNPGLGVRSLHAQGITGAGVNIAIIDQNLFQSYEYHPEYRDKIVAYHDVGCEQSPDGSSYHGPVVTSIAVGETIGTAPGANVYYVASPSWRYDATYHAAALDWIIEQNQLLPEGEKIRVVSFSVDISDTASESHYHENRDAWRAAVQRANDAGILVVDCGDYIIADRGWCDIEDPDNIELFLCDEEGRSTASLEAERIIFVPGGNRTLAEENGGEGQNRYSHFFFSWTGYSWTAPYVSGVLALGWQVNPDLSIEQILDYLFDSAYVNFQGYKVINPSAFIQMIQDNM